MQKHSVQK